MNTSQGTANRKMSGTFESKNSHSAGFVSSQANPGAETRLFLFPFAGGGPAVFSKWSAGLPDKIEAWAAHYPGRGSRHHESPINRLIPLVEKLSHSIRSLLDKPFAFFGHSSGGLVSFELARNLHQKDLPQPTVLFISACRAPHIPDPHAPIRALPDSEFLNALERLNGIPHEILQNPDAMKLLLPTLRADFELIESYDFNPKEPPLDCPIIAFGGLDDPRVSRDHLEGWALHTNSRFESHYFSGDHFFIHSEKESIIESIVEEFVT